MAFVQPFFSYLTTSKLKTMSIIHSGWFAYLKNMIIGLGAAVVLIGALFKIMSWPGANEALTAGLLTEAGLFIMLGLLPPHKDYYWERLYPGLDKYGGPLPGAAGAGGGAGASDPKVFERMESALKNIKLDVSPIESQQKLMVAELQTMAKSMSSLQALQNADFSVMEKTMKDVAKFSTQLNAAVTSISESIEDTKVYREQLSQMNQNMQKLNQVYGGVLAAMKA